MSVPSGSCIAGMLMPLSLFGPVHHDPSWQARTPGAVDLSQFHIDWERKPLTCPHGQQNSAWYQGSDAKGESIVLILFAKQTRPGYAPYASAAPTHAPRDAA